MDDNGYILKEWIAILTVPRGAPSHVVPPWVGRHREAHPDRQGPAEPPDKEQRQREGNRPAQEASAAQRLEGNQAGRQGQAARGGAPSGDRVQVSAKGELVASALKAAHESPEIRQDVVERARQQLAAGEIGNDAGRLADSLIDHLLSR